MPIGILLIIYVLTLYLVGILVLQHCMRGQTQEPTPGTAARFVLREGQTIVGVRDTAKGVDFYIGDDVTDEQ
jgi:hypothetical protein